MENKKYVICFIVMICICFLTVGYFNYEKIVKFFDDKEWEIADSFATLKIENISQVEAGKALLVLTNSNLQLYNNHAKAEYQEDIITTGILSDSCEDYMVIVIKDTNTIYLIKGTEVVWQKAFDWSVLNVSVNKNGYVSLIYLQSGHKSSIKILKPSGEELFTSYLESSYAIDVEMSNDNKELYIAEVDAEGIKLKSNLKIINVASLESNINQSAETILLGTDDLVVDIEYSNKNQLLILKDTGLATIDDNKKVKEMAKFNEKSTLFSSIKNIDNPIVVETVSTGIFTSETNLKILKDTETVEVNIDRTPQNVDTMNGVIALNLGDEVIFLNANGKVIKRYELGSQLTSVKLYDKGNLAALVFRNRIELIKL